MFCRQIAYLFLLYTDFSRNSQSEVRINTLRDGKKIDFISIFTKFHFVLNGKKNNISPYTSPNDKRKFLAQVSEKESLNVFTTEFLPYTRSLNKQRHCWKLNKNKSRKKWHSIEETLGHPPISTKLIQNLEIVTQQLVYLSRPFGAAARYQVKLPIQ